MYVDDHLWREESMKSLLYCLLLKLFYIMLQLASHRSDQHRVSANPSPKQRYYHQAGVFRVSALPAVLVPRSQHRELMLYNKLAHIVLLIFDQISICFQEYSKSTFIIQQPLQKRKSSTGKQLNFCKNILLPLCFKCCK